MVNPETLQRLNAISNNEWRQIWKELLLYTQHKLTGAGFLVRSELDSIAPKDFVQNAIEKLFNGERSWDFIAKPDLTIHLISVIKSLIYSHFKASGRIAINNKSKVQLVEAGRVLDNIQVAEEDDEDEWGEISADHWSAIEAEFDNPDHCLVFIEFLEGKKCADLAEEYQIPIKDIYNITRHGKRICKRIIS